MENKELIPHLFRQEFSKIAAVLCKHFGIAHIEIAEDLASDTFLAALESWTYKGIPANPEAWLYAVAKNKAKNYIQRNHLFAGKIVSHLRNSRDPDPETEIDLSEKNILDSQLQMLFAICHPALSAREQTGLALRILCGFGIEEIANALLSKKEAMNKSLFRAREKLRIEKVRIEFPIKSEINNRLDSVLTTLYLLFNEGYYSESRESILREDLCLEAMRLNSLLLDNEETNQPAVNALFSLMCFHSSRFRARKNQKGEIILYQDQDETIWDQALISKGVYFFRIASRGEILSKYHLEAGIAYWHTIKADTEEKWEIILQLFNHLLVLEYSPIAALNRTYALSKTGGIPIAIAEAEKLKLEDNQYYFALLGELYSVVDKEKAIAHFQKAISLAKTKTDKQTIQNKIDKIRSV
jgi:RNA polymerase sigma factor (sigma-70 family)